MPRSLLWNLSLLLVTASAYEAVALAGPPASDSHAERCLCDEPGQTSRGDSAHRGSAQAGQVTSGRAFNPALSVIPDINAFAGNQQGLAYALMRQADGFAVPGDDRPTTFDPERGFNLRELEIAFSGAVDPYFDVWATVIADADALTVEEAYVQTRQFLPGFRLRIGRFLSGLGYINGQHPHQWDFFDQALPYEALLGGGLADVGLQTTWLPALPFYLQLGFEALQGDAPRLSHRLVGDYPALYEDKAGPRLLTSFVKVAPNLGYAHELQLGASYAYSRSHQEADQQDGFLRQGTEGPAWLLGADVVWRYDSGQEYGRGDLTVQGEYLFRRKDLRVVARNGRPITDGFAERSTQDGFYSQVKYGFAPRWTIAGRYDALGGQNTVETPTGVASLGVSWRAATNVAFSPTEFSRIRVQYSQGEISLQGDDERFNQLAVQFQMSLGAHGAHQF